MHRPRCCEDPDHLVEGVSCGSPALFCLHCGSLLAVADSSGELFADY